MSLANNHFQCPTERIFEITKDYLMIGSLQISNFRGFKHVALSNLPRFNVLIGESASGKTALLEGLWIVGGVSPEIYFRMRALRGMTGDNLQIRSERQVYEAVFNDIFHDPALESGAEIQIIDSVLADRSLTLGYDNKQQLPLEVVKPTGGMSNIGHRTLVFRWKLRETEYECPLKVVNGHVVVENPPPPFPAVLFSSSFLASAGENAERLSTLSISEEKTKIVETITKIFPDIRDISSESIANQQMIWASMKGLRRKIPIAVVSSGINKFLSILLWVCQNRGGVLLVDEIENGFYFSNYEVIFRTLVEFCDAYSVQLFAATHSWEFLKAVAAVMDKRQGDLAMLRTSSRSGDCNIKQIEGISSIAAINQDIEIRL